MYGLFVVSPCDLPIHNDDIHPFYMIKKLTSIVISLVVFSLTFHPKLSNVKITCLTNKGCLFNWDGNIFIPKFGTILITCHQIFLILLTIIDTNNILCHLMERKLIPTKMSMLDLMALKHFQLILTTSDNLFLASLPEMAWLCDHWKTIWTFPLNSITHVTLQHQNMQAKAV